MKTSRPVDAAYGWLEKTQDYKIRLGRECTRPNGGREEHAARFDPDIRIGKGRGLGLKKKSTPMPATKHARADVPNCGGVAHSSRTSSQRPRR